MKRPSTAFTALRLGGKGVVGGIFAGMGYSVAPGKGFFDADHPIYCCQFRVNRVGDWRNISRASDN